MKSYAQSHNSATNYAAKYYNQESGIANVNGYKYTTDGTNYEYYTDVDAIANEAMYRNSSQYWLLASPSSYDAHGVCIVNGDDGDVRSGSVGFSFGVCPLISLKSGVSLELAD